MQKVTQLDIAINELKQAFDEGKESAEEFSAVLMKSFDNILKSSYVDQANKVLRLLSKREKASWITRWYWKRMVNKSYKRLINMTNGIDYL